MTNFAKYGWVDFDWTFGEDNILRDKFFLRDTSQIEAVLQQLLGQAISSANNSVGITPASHYRFKNYYCSRVNIVPCHRKAVQNTGYDSQWLNGLGTSPTVAGVYILTEWKPWTLFHVVEEAWDFGAQSMAVIANAKAIDPTLAIKWQDGTTPSTNLQGVMKSIPTVQLIQKKVLLTQVPSMVQAEVVGSVNFAPFTFMQSDQINKSVWPAETLLCTGLPITRKWHFDGTPRWEASVRIAANILKDKIVDPKSGSTVDGQVTWNMLYRVNWSPPRWEKVVVGAGGTLYPQIDFAQIANLR